MGIQINGQTHTISATDGALNIGGTVTVNVTGDATGLTGTPDITVGVVTASSAVISGDLTVNGTTTTLDTTLTEVDKLEVGANNTTVGVAITQSGSGDILRLYDGATQAVTVTDSGNVGIGTDNPETQLSVHLDSSATGPQLRLTNGNGGDGTYLGRISTGDVAGTFFAGINFFKHDENDGEIRFRTKVAGTNQDVLTIVDGNIGIGTDNPNTKLHVFGSQTLEDTSATGNAWTYYKNADRTWLVGIRGSSGDALSFYDLTSGTDTERMCIDSSGRLLIGNTTKAGDSVLQVYTSDKKHPAIRAYSPSANGFAILGDAYEADESQVNMGVSYSSSALVLSTSVKVSDTADDTYISSQDSFAAKPCAFRMNHQGVFSFLNTDTSATTTTDSAVSLTERLRITSGGYVNIGGNFTQTDYTAQVTRIGGNTDVMQIKGNTQNAFIRFTDSDASSDFTLGADDGPGSNTNNFVIYDRNASAYRLCLNGSGNIGIDNNNPDERLDIGGAIKYTGNNCESIEFAATFSSGTTHTIVSLSNTSQDSVAVATIEYQCLYSYVGNNNACGIKMAATRRVSSNTAWSDTDNQNIGGPFGADTSIAPNFFWDAGVLKITTGSSVQCTGRIRVTVRNMTITRNYTAG
jgi:hypothetical protein